MSGVTVRKIEKNYSFLIHFTKCVLILESTYRHQATIDDEVVSMEILDTAGQVRECVYQHPVPWLRQAVGKGLRWWQCGGWHMCSTPRDWDLLLNTALPPLPITSLLPDQVFYIPDCSARDPAYSFQTLEEQSQGLHWD